MKIFYKRPLAFCLALFIAFFIAFYSFSSLVKCVIFAISLVGAVIAFAVRKRFDKLTGVFCALILSSLLSFLYFNVIIADAVNFNMTDGDIVAEISDITYKNGSVAYFDADIQAINGNSCDIRCHFAVYSLTDDIEIGDVIKTSVDFSEFSDNNYGFDEKSYYRSKGIWVNAEVKEDADFEVIGHINDSPGNALRSVKGYLNDIFKKYTNEDSASFLTALSLGDKSGLADSVKRDFTRCGADHMLAVSGMHFAILLGCIRFFANFLKLSKRKLSGVVIVFCVFYMAITGGAASILRAGIMYIIMSLGGILRRRNDSLTSLLFAVSAIIVFSPSSIFDVGLMLSFTSTLGIIIIVGSVIKYFENANNVFRKLFNYIALSVITTLAALTFSLIPMVIYFDSFSLVTIPANILLSPIITLILFCVPLFFVLSPLTLIVSGFGAFLDIAVFLLLKAANMLSSIAHIEFSLNYSFVLWLFIFYLIGIIFAFIIKKRVALILAYILWSGSFLVSSFIYSVNLGGSLDALFSVEGSNDAVIMRSENKSIYFDFGKGSKSSAKRSFYYLSYDLCCAELDHWIIGKYDETYIATLDKYLNSEFVGCVYLPAPELETEIEIAKEIEKICLKNATTLEFYDYERLFVIEDVEITVDKPLRFKSSQTSVIRAQFRFNDREIDYYGCGYLERGENIENGDIIFVGTSGVTRKQRKSPDVNCNALIFGKNNDKNISDISRELQYDISGSQTMCKIRIE